jgi:succinyl-diaminopimelate desuccinylase
MNPESAIQAALDQLSGEEVVKLTQELIRIPSVNPPGGEEAVARHLAKVLEAEGISSELQWVEPGRPNLIARLGSGEGPHLVFNGHMDVVGAGERSNWTVEPFAGEIRDGRIIGRGSCDMKGGVAALACAFIAIHRAGIDLDGTLSFTAVMGEETGSVGTEFMLAAGFTADASIVGECSTVRQIGIGYRGALWLEIEVRGRTSHGSRPHLGRNAVLGMTDHIIPAVRELVACLDYEEQPLFLIPRPTLNVGSIEGGFKVNVVPDSCKATFDIRLLPGQSIGDLRTAIEGQMRRIENENDGLKVNINVLKEVEPFLTHADSDLVSHLSAACEQVSGESPELIGKTGYSDANSFAHRLGIPSVAFGPGTIGPGHSPDEWVEIEDLKLVARAYVSAALRFCGVASVVAK